MNGDYCESATFRTESRTLNETSWIQNWGWTFHKIWEHLEPNPAFIDGHWDSKYNNCFRANNLKLLDETLWVHVESHSKISCPHGIPKIKVAAFILFVGSCLNSTYNRQAIPSNFCNVSALKCFNMCAQPYTTYITIKFLPKVKAEKIFIVWFKWNHY